MLDIDLNGFLSQVSLCFYFLVETVAIFLLCLKLAYVSNMKLTKMDLTDNKSCVVCKLMYLNSTKTETYLEMLDRAHVFQLMNNK